MLNIVQNVSSCIDRMISRETSASKVSLLEEYLNGESWFFEYKDICKLYSSLADPDALALVPEFNTVFDEKASNIKSEYSDDEETMNKLLIKLSKMRKELDFDARERKVKRNAAIRER